MKKFLMLFFILLLFAGTSQSQIDYSQDFTTGNGSYTGNFSQFTGATACGGSGGAMRRNIYTSAGGEMISPLIGVSNGYYVTLSYDYKVCNWSANTVGTTGNWGYFYVQYGPSATGPWTNVDTVDQANHVVSGNCATRTKVFTPPTGDFYLRFACTWASGDYYMNYDNISVFQYNPAPFINVNPSALNFGFVPNGGASTSQPFTVSGDNLTVSPVTVGPVADFEFSLNNTDFYPSVDVSFTTPTLGNTQVWARFTPTINNNTYVDTIVCSNGEAEKKVAVTGNSWEHNKWCPSLATSPADEDIFNVTIGTINNTSDCTTLAPGSGSILNQYSNYYYDVAPADMEQGAEYVFSVGVGTCGGNYGNKVAIFIDYNQDGDFTDPGETAYHSLTAVTGPNTVSGLITIPPNATLGYTMMRVIAVETSLTILPCTNYSWGETEDYMVNITLATAPLLAVDPASLNLGLVINGQTSDEYSFDLSGLNLDPADDTLTITPSPNFEVSLTQGGPYSATPVTLLYYNETVPSTPVYVVFKPTASNTQYTGNVTVSGGGSVDAIVSLQGASPCDPYTVPWTEGFETVIIPAFPDCWKKENGDWMTTDNASSTFDADALSGTQFLRINWFAIDEYIWTPGFELTEGVSYDFSFWWAGDNYAGWTGDIFYNTDQLSTGAIQMGASFVEATTTTTFTYAQAKRTFVPDSTDVYYFAVRVNEPSGSPWYLSFDDFELEITPNCQEPTALSATNINTTSAELGWAQSGTNVVSWDIELDTTGFTPTGVPTQAGVTNPYNYQNLTAATSYQYYVRAYCGGTDYSSWAGPYTFSTLLCDPSAACNFTFRMTDSYGDGWNGNTMSIIQNGFTVQTISLVSGTGPEDVIIPLCDQVEFQLFWNAGGSYPTEVAIEILDHLGYSVYYKAPGTGTQNTLLYSDIVDCTVPTCFKPTDLTAYNITQGSADVSWTGPTNALYWEVEYDVTGFTQGTGTLITSIAASPQGLSPLAPNTTYDFYVRAFCDVADSSDWSGPVSFTTSLECPSGSYTELEVCGTDSNGGCNMAVPAFEPITIDQTLCGTSWCDGSSRDTDWYTFTLTQTSSVTLNVFAQFDVLFGFIAAPCPATSFIASGTALANANGTLTYTLNAGDYYAFVAPSAFTTIINCGNGNGYNALITVNPCVPPTNLSATNLTTTSTALSWVPQGVATQWEYAFGLYPFAQPTSGIQISNTTVNVAVSPATTYQFYVRSDCGGIFSDWVGPYTFSSMLCDPALQCNYTFRMTDSYGDGWNGNTMTISQTGIPVQTISLGAGFGPVDVQVPLCDGVEFSLFWNLAGSWPEEVGVEILDPSGTSLYYKAPGVGAQNTVLYTDTASCPACGAPYALNATNIQTTSADLSWTGNPNAISYEVEYGISGFILGNGTPISPATSPQQLTNLLPATMYDCYIRSYCGGTEYSSWTGPYTFATACDVISTFPYTQDFSGGLVPAVCWSEIVYNNYGPTYNWYYEATSGSAQVNYDDSYSDTQDEWLVTPEFDFTGIGYPTLQFDWMMSYYWGVDPYDNYDLNCYYTVDNGTNWLPLWSEASEGVFSNFLWYTEQIAVPALANAPSVKFAWQYIGYDGAQANVDNVVVYNDIPPTKDVNLTVMLEGLYIDDTQMRFAQNYIGNIYVNNFGGDTADVVDVELWDLTVSTTDPVHEFLNQSLKSDGSVTVQISSSIIESYFIVIRHRNSIETWSAAAEDFSGAGPIVYDFTDAATKAYGSNLKLMGTKYVIYGGDVTQDGYVEGGDIALLDNAVTALLKGYFPEDLNGDGAVDGSDLALIDNNVTAIVAIKRP